MYFFLKHKRKLGLLFLIAFFTKGFGTVCAQKPFLKNDSYMHWDALMNYDISNDGKFVWYCHASLSSGISLVIRALDSDYSHDYFNISGRPTFTSDSKHILFIADNSLNIVRLKDGRRKMVSNVISFFTPEYESTKWVAYYREDGFYLLNLMSGETEEFGKTKMCVFNGQGTAMVLGGDSLLEWVELGDLKRRRVIHNGAVSNVVFNFAGDAIAFCPIINKIKFLFYYKRGMDNSIELLGPESGFAKEGRVSFRDPQFTNDGTSIYFSMVVPSSKPMVDSSHEKKLNVTNLRLWHYKESYMRPILERLNEVREIEISAAVNVADRKVILLEKPNLTSIIGGSKRGNNFVITHVMGNYAEQNWNEYQKSYELVSIKDGSSIRILNDAPVYTMDPKLSPNERFVSWYDYSKNGYFIYEIASGEVREVTIGIKGEFVAGNDERYADLVGFTYGSFWTADDRGLIVYDKYDIWQVDPYGVRDPINITNGQGRRNAIMFRLAANEFAFPPPSIGDTLLLAAFDISNKKNGLFKVILGKENALNVGNMADAIYYYPWIFASRTPKEPLKAKYSDVYVLQHMKSNSAPNICVTRDFKSFRLLSDIQPQKKYNWMTTELIKWKQKDGREMHGILYKPENFDSTRKYPIILHYYEKTSQELNLYKFPELSSGALDIPWYVSNEYLVFVPDIYMEPGRPAEGIINSVASAIERLSQFSWVDKKKIGLQGHSFGGYETFVLATGMNCFAAAQASAGLSDFISGYGSLGGGAGHLFEVGQNNMRSLPWERQDLYIESSPVLKAGNVVSPMLIMHNKDDGAVDFVQSLEMYVALRRQKKPVWMLEYIGEGHTLSDQDNKLDFTIRQQQFFAHYLKDSLAAGWMLEPTPVN